MLDLIDTFEIITLSVIYSECYAIINSWYAAKVFSPFLCPSHFDWFICEASFPLLSFRWYANEGWNDPKLGREQ